MNWNWRPYVVGYVLAIVTASFVLQVVEVLTR